MNKGSALAAALLVGFAACGDQPSSSDSANADDAGVATDSAALDDGGSGDAAPISGIVDEHGGSRLKLASYTTADGFRQRFGLYDAQLGVECAPQTAGDGARRCLPTRTPTPYVYADAQCMQPLIASDVCSTEKPAYAAIVEPSPSCAGNDQRRIHTLGAEVPTPAALYFKSSAGCQSTAGGNASQKYWPVGVEVDASSFVAVTETTTKIAPNLELVFVESADGMRAFDHALDPAHGPSNCAFTWAMDAKARCVPSIGAQVGVLAGRFRDPSCSTEIANAACDAFGVAQRYVPGCPARAQLYRVGPVETTDAGVFVKGSSGCTAEVAPPNAVFRDVAEEVAPTELAEVSLVPSSNSTRLRFDAVVLPNGARLLSSTALSTTWSDTEGPLTVRPNDCQPSVAADGKLRCLPALFSVEAFADDGCQVPVVLVPKTACKVPNMARVASTDTCGAPHAHALTGKRNGSAFYVKVAGTSTCELQTSSSYDLYDISSNLPPTAFVEVSKTYD